jgi:hypothetical protein
MEDNDMAAEEYDTLHHMRRDVHDAHTNSQIAKVLSTLAMIASVISLALALWALDKAGEASSNANRSLETVQQRTQ